jgi:predicted O-methyltransferase YrrM
VVQPRLSTRFDHSILQIVDNVVRWGRVSDPSYTDGNVEGVRRLLRAIKGDKEVDTTTLATTGEKGYDGFLYAIRK